MVKRINPVVKIKAISDQSILHSLKGGHCLDRAIQ